MQYRIAAVVLAVCLLAGASFTAASAQDPEKGKQLARKCVCHKSRNDIQGKSEAFIIERLEAFRAGKADPQSMRMISEDLTDQEIKDLAAYYSGL